MDRAGSGGWWLASDGCWYPPQAETRVRATLGSRTLITGGLIAAIVAGLVGLAVIWRSPIAPLSVPPPVPSSPGRALFARATNDAGLQGWVHISVSATFGTTATVLTGDVGPSDGQETIHIGKQSATAIYLGQVAYAHFDSAALAQALGLPSMSAAAFGRWVSFEPADRGFGPLTQGLTLSSAVSQLFHWPDHLSLGSPPTVDGQQVVPITGEARLGGRTIKATLDVTRSAHPLPVEINASGTAASETVIFSNWGRPVTIAAPSGAQPASGLTG